MMAGGFDFFPWQTWTDFFVWAIMLSMVGLGVFIGWCIWG